MSEMVERVARAMFPSTFAENSGLAVTRNERRKTAMNKARAAIAAMREPTPEMMREFNSWALPTGYTERGWQAMIDEALK